VKPGIPGHAVRVTLYLATESPEVAMKSFDELLRLLGEIPDPRRAEGKKYTPAYVLLFAILAVVTGSNSYRGIRTFIQAHRVRLNAAFGLNWKRAPAHTAIRYILQGLNPEAVERIFRQHAANLNAQKGARTNAPSRSTARR
jgi:hypothetical protein